MDNPFGKARLLPSVLYDYVAADLADSSSAAVRLRGEGMPPDSFHIKALSTVVGITCGAAPMFRSKAHRLAGGRALDVVLLRCCLGPADVLPVSIDIALARGGLAATCMHDLALYRHGDGDLWLVPAGYAGAIRMGGGGLELFLVPPYSSMAERAQGIYRSISEIAQRLHLRDGLQ